MNGCQGQGQGFDLIEQLTVERPAAPAADEPMHNLSDYDWIMVNTSAGKDSMAMMDLVAQHAAAQGVSDRIVAVHADLGRVEWANTKELAQEQAERYGFRFEVSSAANWSDLLEYVEHRGMWPSSDARYCTSDFKRGPIRRIMTALVKESREADPSAKQRQVRILNCMGLRAQESPARAKKAIHEEVKSASNGRRLVEDYHPILRWTEPQVWQRIGDSRMSDLVHHAYSLGMPRLSCVFCVFAPKAALVTAAKANPELAREYAEVEARIGHRFTMKLSMAEVIEAAGTDEQVEMEAWVA